ncbi:MAG: hypothetical protein LBN93_09535 [Candidatus Symbiothrix sp.]|jgi:hypothetical protein|nr:hypothetical protein [Candidatus Symbiothrix sp.]
MTSKTLTEFYRLVKLNLWHSGQVTGYGQVDKIEVFDDCTTNKGVIVRKELADYVLQPTMLKQLCNGLYLLDFYDLEDNLVRRESTYIAVVAVCRQTLEHIECVTFLKIRDHWKSPFYKKRKYKGLSDRIDTSPINSYRRNY